MNTYKCNNTRENAFNSVNRLAALHNIQVLCPPFSCVLINSYRDPVRMVISGGGEIMSCEGATQGGCMLLLLPHSLESSVIASWIPNKYGMPMMPQVQESAQRWWDCLTSIGPKYGYFPKSPKCHLVVKPEFKERAKIHL